MLHTMNSVDRTAENLAAQRAITQWAWANAITAQRDHADGYRKFWRGLSETYCANAAERDGYRAAVEEASAVTLQTRITRKVTTAEDEAADAETDAYLAQRWAEIDEYNAVRETMTW